MAVGVTAVVDVGVCVGAGGLEGFDVAVGCDGTGVYVSEGVGNGVKELVTEGLGVSVTVAKRVLRLVAVTFGVRVGRVVVVGITEAVARGTAVPGASIVTTIGEGTTVSEGTGVTNARKIGAFRLPDTSPELPGVRCNPAESCVASAKIASFSCANRSLSLSI